MIYVGLCRGCGGLVESVSFCPHTGDDKAKLDLAEAVGEMAALGLRIETIVNETKPGFKSCSCPQEGQPELDALSQLSSLIDLAADEIQKLGLLAGQNAFFDQEEIFEAISRERAYQDDRWGTIEDNPHEVPTWIAIMQRELDEAYRAFLSGDWYAAQQNALAEILQAVTVGVACLEQYGVVERPRSSNDE